MPHLRVGVVVRWPDVGSVVVAMLEQLGHEAVDAQADDSSPPDLVVRDNGLYLPGGWAGRPAVVLSGSSRGVAVNKTGDVQMGKPFSTHQLVTAIRLAVGIEG